MKDLYGAISLTPGNPRFKEFARGAPRARSFVMKVSYKTPLTTTLAAGESYRVTVAISGIGFVAGSTQHVIRTSAAKIDFESFELTLETWGSTQIEFVDLNWHFFVEPAVEFHMEELPD